MQNKENKLLNWAIDRIQKEYKDDICLLIGNAPLHRNPDQNNCYMDYFVPATERGNQFAQTFIIEGLGYDIYPRSWERLEHMANLDDYNTTCLGYGEILYARSDADKERFFAIQQKLKENLSNTSFMYRKALEKLDVAMEIYQTVAFEEQLGRVRTGAGFIADYLSCAVAFINHTYFKYSQVEQPAELSAMKELPDRFLAYYDAIIQAKTADQLRELSHSMIAATRRFLKKHRPAGAPKGNADFAQLADWYQELSYTWARIYFWCDRNDRQKVFVWGCMLQQELNTVTEEFGLQPMDLMGVYQAGDLEPVRRRAQELERYIVQQIKSHGVQLKTYDTVEEFISQNS
ncbi:MAG TPA: hypothetical protein IAA58_11745 [Candidatus Gallacutalibacter stercoravium]|nr:hypothetical protein [Candidatus Gallacutalibacter stercoravium]